MPELKFLGHACFMLKEGPSALIIDPFLTGNPQAAATADQIDCQYILFHTPTTTISAIP